jgi:hypothetical protein
MNLYPDTCRPFLFARSWLPGRYVADHDLITPISAKARGHLSKSIREGYTCTIDQYDYRNSRLDEILAINQSKPIRQGREMDDSYNHPGIINSTPFCDHHHFKLILCLDRTGVIVGYMELYIVGEFAQTSRILGHADHMHNGIMVQIFDSALKLCRSYGVSHFVYGEWNSGTQGLQDFKKSIGFVSSILII